MRNTGVHTAPAASGSRKKNRRRSRKKKKNRSPSPVSGTDGEEVALCTDGKDVAGWELLGTPASSGVSTPKKLRKQKRSASPVNDAEGGAKTASVEACHAAAPSADCGRDPNSGLDCAVASADHIPADCGREPNSGVECAAPPADCGTEAIPVEECEPLPHGCTDVNSGEEFAAPAEGITEVNTGEISAPKKKRNLWQQHRHAPAKCEDGAPGAHQEHQELKIKSSPAAADLSKIAHDNGEQPARIINNEEIEGFYWSDAYLEEAIRCYKEQVNLRLPDIDDVFWSSYDGQELKQLNELLAMHRIKAHEISKGALLERLVDTKLEKEYPRAIFEDSEYYECYEMDFEWYFDREYIRFVGFEDYQRLVLRETDYLHWDKYRETYCTYKADQEFVEFYEKLSSKTKWLANALSVRNHEERLRYQRLAFYEAVKIAAGFKNIRLALVYTCVSEYIWSVEYERSTYGPIASLYFEIWKRVAKGKMSFVRALKQVYDEDICVLCRFEMKLELDYGPKSGPMKINYDNYVAYVSSRVPENEAHLKIMEAVKKFVPKQKTYYDYARKKLDIARKIGVIPLQKATC